MSDQNPAGTEQTAPAGTTDSDVKDSLLATANDVGGADDSAGKQEADPNATPAEGEAKEGDGKEASKEDDKKPVEYADFTLPEGVAVDTETLDKFKSEAAEIGLSQEHAQRLVDLYTDRVKAVAEAPYREWETTQQTWVDEIKADGELNDLDKVLQTSAKVFDKFMPGPEGQKLRHALTFTGAGNNPEIVRFVYRIGKAISEDSFEAGRGAASAPKSLAEKMYPNHGQGT